ncbi:hypothetical protein fh0823_25640 [Francisella halioticida]|nr:hypothetical protein fh0823_25640 [Francisella halioticida]
MMALEMFHPNSLITDEYISSAKIAPIVEKTSIKAMQRGKNLGLKNLAAIKAAPRYAIEHPIPIIRRLTPIRKIFGEKQYRIFPMSVMRIPIIRIFFIPNLSRIIPLGICKIA